MNVLGVDDSTDEQPGLSTPSIEFTVGLGFMNPGCVEFASVASAQALDGDYSAAASSLLKVSRLVLEYFPQALSSG